MNSIKQKYLIIAFIIGIIFSSHAQSWQNNPTANSINQNEYTPIDLVTGLPRVTIPLFSLPTLAESVNINMTLNYHPASVSVEGATSGNCGRGWTIPFGGAIVGDYASTRVQWQSNTSGARAYFNFGFQGASGKIYVHRSGSTLVGYLEESENNSFAIIINHDPTTYKINSFTLYNDKGYKYIFDARNTYVNIGLGRSVETYMFSLSSIKDSNDAVLATFNYNTYQSSESSYYLNEKNQHHVLKNIVTHYGKIEINNSLSVGYNSNAKFTKITVSDFKNNFIRRFDFFYNDDNLLQVDESDLEKTTSLSHKFDYRSPSKSFKESYGRDKWGYQNLNLTLCSSLTGVTPWYVTNGVLEKITLPSGGAIVYQYESNTYSFDKTQPIDAIKIGQFWSTSSRVFSRFEYDNLHNFQAQTVASGNFSNASSVVNFTVTGTGTKNVYIKVSGEEYFDPLISGGGTSFPTFRLKKDGVVVGTFNVNSVCENSGLGTLRELTAGNYSFSMLSSAPTTGRVEAMSYTASSTVKSWHHGNGIRIKKIGYFEDATTVSSDYYYNLSPTVFPVKETSYDYSLASNSSRSSGCNFAVDTYNPEIYTINYKNVTVKEKGNNGKTVYTFYSPLDYYQIADFDGQTPNFNKLKETKVYNESGELLQQKNYTYKRLLIGLPNLDPQFRPQFMLDANLPTEIIEKNYSNGSFIETITNYDYDADLNVMWKKEITDSNGNFILNNYTYNYLNTAITKNRRAVEKIDTYRNADLLFTKKINFSTTWPTILEPGPNQTTLPPFPNASYLPASIQSSKGSEVLTTERRFNFFDGYSRPWEIVEENGLKTVCIWGYNHTQIVAKIENMEYNSVPQNLINAIVLASNTGTEAELITAQNNLRAHANLVNAMITTYTYKPLIGVSTVTDAKRQTVTHTYDIHNRLKIVKDGTGKILSENEYKIRTQN